MVRTTLALTTPLSSNPTNHIERLDRADSPSWSRTVVIGVLVFGDTLNNQAMNLNASKGEETAREAEAGAAVVAAATTIMKTVRGFWRNIQKVTAPNKFERNLEL